MEKSGTVTSTYAIEKSIYIFMDKETNIGSVRIRIFSVPLGNHGPGEPWNLH
jgi:hypothetical protein